MLSISVKAVPNNAAMSTKRLVSIMIRLPWLAFPEIYGKFYESLWIQAGLVLFRNIAGLRPKETLPSQRTSAKAIPTFFGLTPRYPSNQHYFCK
jgi:hypothetical protein